MANQTTTYAPVAVAPCADYDDSRVTEALNAVLVPIGGLDWVREGMTVGIKSNLVSAMKPEECATTHPALLCALTRMLRERGARVVIGDSPGGLYTPAFVEHVYAASGMNDTVAAGAELNHDYGQTDATFPEARVLRSFTYTSWLDGCDAIINFCKLKSHGMMGMSAAAKNLFGVIPGTMKPEYHFRFPNMADFAHMLVDINDYFAPQVKLSLVDAVGGRHQGSSPTHRTSAGFCLGARGRRSGCTRHGAFGRRRPHPARRAGAWVDPRLGGGADRPFARRSRYPRRTGNSGF